MKDIQIGYLALGGSFDHFHKGHQKFINQALKLSEKILIGITSDDYARKIHKKSLLQNFKFRKKQVDKFILRSNLKNININIIKLTDSYGPTIDEAELDALLITENTKKGGELINSRRLENGLNELALIKVDLEKSEEGGVISSSRIRNGEISRIGIHYHNRLIKSAPLTLPAKYREEFRKPFGKLFPEKTNHSQTMEYVKEWIELKKLKPVICVGDEVTRTYLDIGGNPELKVVDLKVQRKKKYQKTAELGTIGHLPHYLVDNPPAAITRELIDSIKNALDRKQKAVIHVKGEEDLAVLPAVLLAPLNAVIFYGHFKLGVVAVKVTEAKKAKALSLLQKIS